MYNSQDSLFCSEGTPTDIADTITAQLEKRHPNIDEIIDRYEENPALFAISATQKLCQFSLSKKQAERLTELAKNHTPESCAFFAFHAINTTSEKKIISRILDKAPEALDITIVDDDRLFIDTEDSPAEDHLINWLLFLAKSDDLCATALQIFLDPHLEALAHDRKIDLLTQALLNTHQKATLRLLCFLNPAEDNLLELLPMTQFDNFQLAFLVHIALGTPHEEVLLPALAERYPEILHTPIEESVLAQWILFHAQTNAICQNILKIYCPDTQSIFLLRALFSAALKQKNTQAIKHILQFHTFEPHDPSITDAINTEIWEKLRQVCASYMSLIELSNNEEILGWNALDIEALLPKAPLKKLPKLAAPIALLVYHGFMPPPDLTTRFKELTAEAEARNNQSLSDWTYDNPIDEFENVAHKFELITTLNQITHHLQHLATLPSYANLASEDATAVLTQLRQASANELFKALTLLAKKTPDSKIIPFEMPTTLLDKAAFHNIIITTFLKKPILNYQDWLIVHDLLHLIKPENVMTELGHREHSGPTPDAWNKAPDQQKYVCALKEDEHTYRFYALPLIDLPSETNEALLIERAELALLSSLFYHSHKHAWTDPLCIEIRKLLNHLDPTLPLKGNETLFKSKYAELEATGYYAECPSDDSEDESSQRFLKQPIGNRNALLTFAERMMVYGQVDRIWTKEKNKLREPVGTAKGTPASVDFYDVTARAEIHHDHSPPVAVLNDLSLLNEHAVLGALTPETLREIKTKFVIAQYRGIHYDTLNWSQKKRQQARKDEKNQTIYASAVFKKADITPDDSAITTQEKLQKSAQLLHHQLTCLNYTGATHSHLSSKEYLFEHAAHALQDAYTKDYDQHQRARQHAQTLKDQHEPISSPMRVALLFSLGPENYNNSTGDTPYHACRYAYGLKEYGIGKGKRLRPRWHNEGKAERPYSGEIFTFLFDLETYLALAPHHLISLDHKRQVSVDALTLAERETAFVAYIPEANIVEHKVLRYPNFNKPYNTYYQHKYGMDKALYEQFQKELLASKPHSKENKKIKLLIGEHLCAYQEACLIEDARLEAKRKDSWLIYRDRTGGFSLVPPPLKPATRGAGAEAGNATRTRQEKLMEARKNLPSGWLEKKLQHQQVIPGNHYQEVLTILCPRIKEHIETAITSSSLTVPETSWIKYFKAAVRPSMQDYVKIEFQNTLDALARIAQNNDLSIVIESFLFEEDNPIILNNTAPETIHLIYLGGDGFHGLTDKSTTLPADPAANTTTTPTAITNTSAAPLTSTDAATATVFHSTSPASTPAHKTEAGFKRKRNEEKPPANTPNLLKYFSKEPEPSSSAAKRARTDNEETSDKKI